MYSINPNKKILMRASQWTGLHYFFSFLQRKRYSGNYVRAINYHETPLAYAREFEDHVRYYNQAYSSVSLDDLSRFLGSGQWHKDKPGLIISFDDGRRDNYEVAAPILEKYGFTGWFFVPIAFSGIEGALQYEYAQKHRISTIGSSAGDRIAMSLDCIKELSEKHVIGSHTNTHARFYKNLPDAEMRDEIFVSKHRIEDAIGKKIDAFCWVGGESNSYRPDAMPMLREAGYRYVFTTISEVINPGQNPYMLGRTNVNPGWSVDYIKFMLSGIVDLYYLKKRRYLYRLLNQEKRNKKNVNI